MICSVAALIGGFDLSQDQPIGRTLGTSGEWAWFIEPPNKKRQITSQMPAGRNRKASLPASTRPPTFSAVAALNNTPSVFALISAAMNQNDGSFGGFKVSWSRTATGDSPGLRCAATDPTARRRGH
jgi:hypothetical protein